MKTSTIIIWIIIIVVIVFGGWWLYSSSQSAASSQTPTQTTSQTTPTPTLSMSSSPTLGSYLVDSNGMTLYMYAKDSVGTSTCYGGCAQAWPPYIVSSASDIVPLTGATGTVATITRTDGTMQVTYNGMPLYLYAEDQNPGDTTGQGVANVWSIVHP